MGRILLNGIPRFTKDLDILVDENLRNIARLERSLNNLGFRPRVPVSISGLRVHLVSIDDLIKMKKKANRQQDLADINALKRLKLYEKK